MTKPLTPIEVIQMKVTQRMLDNELHTFCSRTEKQLIIRTRMIFDLIKLKACEMTATTLGVKSVSDLARRKLNKMVQ